MQGPGRSRAKPHQPIERRLDAQSWTRGALPESGKATTVFGMHCVAIRATADQVGGAGAPVGATRSVSPPQLSVSERKDALLSSGNALVSNLKGLDRKPSEASISTLEEALNCLKEVRGLQVDNAEEKRGQAETSWRITNFMRSVGNKINPRSRSKKLEKLTSQLEALIGQRSKDSITALFMETPSKRQMENLPQEARAQKQSDMQRLFSVINGPGLELAVRPQVFQDLAHQCEEVFDLDGVERAREVSGAEREALPEKVEKFNELADWVFSQSGFGAKLNQGAFRIPGDVSIVRPAVEAYKGGGVEALKEFCADTQCEMAEMASILKQIADEDFKGATEISIEEFPAFSAHLLSIMKYVNVEQYSLESLEKAFPLAEGLCKSVGSELDRFREIVLANHSELFDRIPESEAAFVQMMCFGGMGGATGALPPEFFAVLETGDLPTIQAIREEVSKNPSSF